LTSLPASAVAVSIGIIVMQYLVVLSVLGCAAAAPQLVQYPNGAVAPFDPNNAKATAEHLAATAEAGKLVNPLNVHATALHYPVVYAPAVYGRKKREAQLVHYPNGAVAPYDPNVAIATANHYAAKAAAGVYPYAGAAVVHPPAAALYAAAPVVAW